MNELTSQATQLPDTLEDLTQFVLVGKATLQAYMLKLRTVNRLSVAQEIRDQTFKEAQDMSNALIAAEQRIGELLLAIPKQSGARTDLGTSAERTDEVKSKSEVIAEMGYERHDAHDYQQMAKHPEVVRKVIADALENGEIVTKASVMREIKFYKDRIKAMEEVRQKPEIKEVVPDDYEDIKRQRESYEQENKKLLQTRKKDVEEIKQLKARLAELESRKDIAELQKKLEEEAGYFAIRTYDYIQKNGGYVWVTERMEKLSGESRKQFIHAVYAIDAFSKQMIENIGGYGIE